MFHSNIQPEQQDTFDIFQFFSLKIFTFTFSEKFISSLTAEDLS